MAQLKEAMMLLIAGNAPLAPQWKDHALKGEWSAARECPVGGDFLLIYQMDESVGPRGMMFFTRAGKHSELFRWGEYLSRGVFWRKSWICHANNK